MKRIVLSDGNRKNAKGFKLALSGMSTDRFKDNPIMLYAHNQEKVIGRWENWTVRDNRLEADPIFDKDDELGAEVMRKYENNFLRAASIGVIVLDMEEIDGEWTVTKSELLEASIVAIPADAGAIVLYNENKEVLSLEQIQLNFSNKPINNQTMEFKLSQKTQESLSLESGYTPKDVELAVAEKDRKIVELEAKIETQRKEQVEAYLTAATKAGKITEAERTGFATLAHKDFDSVKAIIDSKGESASASLADQVQKTTLTAGREDWNYLKWMKEDPKGLQKLKLENPKEFEKLQLTLKK